VVSEVCAGGFGAGRVRRTKHERPRKACGLIWLMCRCGSDGSAVAEGKKLNGLLLGRVRKWGFYSVLESDLMGWRVGGPALFCPAMPLGMSGVSRKRGSVLPGSVSGRRSIHFPVGGAV